MANFQVWFRLNNGEWNGSPSADPVANVGGIDISAMAGPTMFPTVQATGDAGITCNFGATGFSFSVPSGYTAGWPHVGGGFTTLDPTKLYGSASISGADLACSFPTAAGMAQAVDGYATGQYYFELVNPTADIFSAWWGGGVAANFAAGGNYNYWMVGAAFSGSSNLGGAQVSGQGLAHELSSLIALGSAVVRDVFDFAAGVGNVVGVAVFLTAIPLQPGVPAPFCGDTHTTSSFTASWTPAGAAATSYTLDYRKVLDVSFTEITGITGTSQVITGLDRGTAYEFKVNAINGAGDSGFSALTQCSTSTVFAPVSAGATLCGWRGLCGINWHGMALVGDKFSNVIGLSDFTIFKEYSNPMRMLVTSPPMHDDRKRIFVPRFEIEVEAGLGLPNAPETAPIMVLDISKDGGVTWQPMQKFRSMGAAGEYRKRLRWLALGHARQWIFRLTYSDAARPAIIGAYGDFNKGLG